MKWIDVKDSLPESDVPVLALDNDIVDIWIMQYICGKWYCPQEGWEMNITHWMPLPEPPMKKIEK